MSGLFTSFDVSASGLSAQRRRLDVISENIANIETTRTPEGGPYRRKRAVLQSINENVINVTARRSFLALYRSNSRHMGAGGGATTSSATSRHAMVELAVEDDPRPFRMDYDPGHPDADADGYVLKPNVNIVEEMVDMILAVRAYQANAAAFDAAKDMFTVSLEI